LVDKPRDPWTDPDPEPGDFDAELDSGQLIEIRSGNPHARLVALSAGEKPKKAAE
jgi:hypothetical protein